MTKIAINGFGRIGRSVFKIILKNHPDLEIAAINDLTDPKTLAYLLRYDSVYGIYDKRPHFTGNNILPNGTKGDEIIVLAEKDPENLPWKKMGVDIVLECTGIFTKLEGAEKHIKAGCKKVIISAPAKSKGIPSFVLGVNENKYNPKKDNVIDMASCTTNCLAPIAKVLHENFKISKGFITTIHSYTNSQRLLDAPHKDLRRARAAAINIIPTTTGAAKAIGKVLPELDGKLDGRAVRVPVPTVSFLDFVCKLEKKTTSEELNYIFKKASQKDQLRGILGVEDADLVSSDYTGSSFSAVIDSACTMAIDDLIRVSAWYDNEWAYAGRLAELAEFVGKKI